MTATWHRVPPPMGDDEPNNAPWEPWTPRVGDRVRVRLSGECRRSLIPDARQRRWGIRTGHFPDLDLVTGVVKNPAGWISQEAFELTVRDGHWYLVLFDYKVVIDGYAWSGDCFAAAELEPLSDSEPAADERRRAG